MTTSWRSGIDRRALLAISLAALLPAATALLTVRQAGRSQAVAPATGVEAAAREARELTATVLSLRLAAAPALTGAT
ncbi:MAG: hypothetical protein Q8S73_19710, partial [Deltaproteobacteria bacterium]|nr:hypothetical protein [Deltaproteobacteria bacterium]